MMGIALFGIIFIPLAVAAVVEAWCLELIQRSPKKSAWPLYSKGFIALPTAQNNNAVARERC